LDKQHKYLSNRVSIYLNVFRPNGNTTELGNFYFCRHPEHCLVKSASGLFAVDTITGLAKYYSKNSQAGNRGTVRRHRENNTISNNGIRYINADIFIDKSPKAIAEVGSTYQLTKRQLLNLPNNPKL